MAPRPLIAFVLGCWCAGCFEVRALDRRFDAASEDAAAIDGGAEAGPVCADIDKSCDGIDDDCDGRYDEDFAEAAVCGIGQCRAGSTPARCVSGFPIDCLPGPAADERCDGLDNDCDGAVDEDLQRNCGQPQGVCTRGTERCEGGAWSACDGIEPGVESCDGRDEDCDGAVDEGLTRPCEGGGRCGEGVELCDDGEWQGCDAMGGAPEQCNGVDDDCDGAVDEGVAPRDCGSNVGVCRQGQQACVGGAWSECEGQIEPAPVDVCDGRDDDCDTAVDEGDGPCGACGLDSRPLCPVGQDPCPEIPPFTVCIREVTRFEGELGARLGAFVAATPDLNGDGVDDFVTAGPRRVLAFSGLDGDELWNRDGAAGEAAGLVVADLDGDGRGETLVADVESAQGELRVFGPGGERQGTADGTAQVNLGPAVAAVDDHDIIAVGAVDGRDGDGLVRLLRYEGGQVDPEWVDITLDDGVDFGAALAMGRDAEGEPVLLATDGPVPDRRVVLLQAPIEQPQEALEVIPRGPGVGEALLIGTLVEGLPPAAAALNASQPWVDLGVLPFGPGEQSAIRLPIGDVGSGLALIPGVDGRPPLLAVAVDDTVHLLRIGPEGSAAVAAFELPDDVRGPVQQGPVLAAASRGPQGSRLLAVGIGGGIGTRGQVVVFRID